MIGEINQIGSNIKLTMLSIPLLVLRILLLITLKIIISELGSQDTPKALSVGSSSRSKFTIFGDKFPGDVFFKISRLFEINFAKEKPPSFKRVTTSVMILLQFVDHRKIQVIIHIKPFQNCVNNIFIELLLVI